MLFRSHLENMKIKIPQRKHFARVYSDQTRRLAHSSSTLPPNKIRMLKYQRRKEGSKLQIKLESSSTMERNLQKIQVGNHPTVLYIPQFITETQQTQLLDKIYEVPPSKWKSLKNRRLQNWGGVVHEKGLLPQDLPPWLMNVAERICDESGLFPSAINHVLINEYLPDQGIMGLSLGSFSVNPCNLKLIFSLLHTAGSSSSLHAVCRTATPRWTCLFSCGGYTFSWSPVVMDLTPHPRFSKMGKDGADDGTFGGEVLEFDTCEKTENHQPFSVLLLPQSLLIFKDSAYSECLHGIKNSVVQQYDKAINEAEALMHDKADQPILAYEDAEPVKGDPKVIHRTTTRVSLTFRLVPKVRKNLFKF